MKSRLLHLSAAERGSAAILVAGVCALVVALGLGLAMVSAAAYASARARSTADLSALAGATARVGELMGVPGRGACAAAATVATANGATVRSCSIDRGVNVTVRVSVPAPQLASWTGASTEATASARAGPAPP